MRRLPEIENPRPRNWRGPRATWESTDNASGRAYTRTTKRLTVEFTLQSYRAPTDRAMGFSGTQPIVAILGVARQKALTPKVRLRQNEQHSLFS